MKARPQTQLETSEAITDLARRSQTLQMMREALYRLSELQANTGMDPERAAQVYLEVIKAMQAMAYAELGNSALDPQTKRQLLDSIREGTVLEPNGD